MIIIGAYRDIRLNISEYKQDIKLTDHRDTRRSSAILFFVDNVNSDKQAQFV